MLLDLTMALSNPIKFFNAHDKKSAKSQETNSEVSAADNGTYAWHAQPDDVGI